MSIMHAEPECWLRPRGTAVDQRRCAGRKCSGGGPDGRCGSAAADTGVL